MSWVKLPALEGKPNPCANCPPIEPLASLEKIIAVGFGSATVERDGVVVYSEPVGDAFDDEEAFWDFNRAEQMAMLDPDHDWRAVFFGPLHGETYQRQGPDRWVLVEKNEGFA